MLGAGNSGAWQRFGRASVVPGGHSPATVGTPCPRPPPWPRPPPRCPPVGACCPSRELPVITNATNAITSGTSDHFHVRIWFSFGAAQYRGTLLGATTKLRRKCPDIAFLIDFRS